MCWNRSDTLAQGRSHLGWQRPASSASGESFLPLRCRSSVAAVGSADGRRVLPDADPQAILGGFLNAARPGWQKGPLPAEVMLCGHSPFSCVTFSPSHSCSSSSLSLRGRQSISRVSPWQGTFQAEGRAGTVEPWCPEPGTRGPVLGGAVDQQRQPHASLSEQPSVSKNKLWVMSSRKPYTTLNCWLIMCHGKTQHRDNWAYGEHSPLDSAPPPSILSARWSDLHFFPFFALKYASAFLPHHFFSPNFIHRFVNFFYQDAFPNPHC